MSTWTRRVGRLVRPPGRGKPYYRAMSEMMRDEFRTPEFSDQNGNFHWSAWVHEVFDPEWRKSHPPPLCVDGRAYRRRVRRR